MSVFQIYGRAIDSLRLTSVGISSHIKGKASHKIVSDGKFLEPVDLAERTFFGFFEIARFALPRNLR